MLAHWGVLGLLVCLNAACGGDDEPRATAGAGGGPASGGAGGAAAGGVVPCDDDTLRTGLVAQQTGVSVDAFDCSILAAAARHGEPDPLLIKAVIYVECRFDHLAVGCPNLPCGLPSGWTTEEAGCLGLMQIVPACGGELATAGLLPNGHPNMTTDPTSSAWATSIFNPEVNIDLGVAGLAGNRAQVEAEFPGCTEDQYTLMALGNYSSYGSTQGCTVYNTDYVSVVLEAYAEYAQAAGYPARAY